LIFIEHLNFISFKNLCSVDFLDTLNSFSVAVCFYLWQQLYHYINQFSYEIFNIFLFLFSIDVHWNAGDLDSSVHHPDTKYHQHHQLDRYGLGK
jgi:glycerol uptake facilitator-like aquaporin